MRVRSYSRLFLFSCVLIFIAGVLWAMDWHLSDKEIDEIQIFDGSNLLDISTAIQWHTQSGPWMTIVFDPKTQAKIKRGWSHDAETVRILTSMSQEFDAYDRLNRAIGELINLDREKAMEILVKYLIIYHPDSETQIGYKVMEEGGGAGKLLEDKKEGEGG